MSAIIEWYANRLYRRLMYAPLREPLSELSGLSEAERRRVLSYMYRLARNLREYTGYMEYLEWFRHIIPLYGISLATLAIAYGISSATPLVLVNETAAMIPLFISLMVSFMILFDILVKEMSLVITP